MYPVLSGPMSHVDPHSSLRESAAPYSLPSVFMNHITVFRGKLSDIDARSQNPAADHEQLFRETVSACNEMIGYCEEYEQRFAHAPEVIKQARIDFRALTADLFLKSYFMERARTWPQGYPGDYLTLESVYKKTPLSTGLGHYLDQHFLASTLGNAVRDRISTLTDILHDVLGAYQAPTMLNIACGSCRELVGLSRRIREVNGTITCIDHDDAALEYSMNRLSAMQDVIYSAGFFDYMKDDVLIRILSSAYRMLRPGGTLVAPFKDATRYKTQEYHWFVDWTGFLQRTPDEIMAVIEKAGIPRERLRTQRDKTGVILFVVATA
jgi:extracellular factor (EF) 3-hydroxypalmitic acid methyl ester biosynthesis protein